MNLPLSAGIIVMGHHTRFYFFISSILGLSCICILNLFQSEASISLEKTFFPSTNPSLFFHISKEEKKLTCNRFILCLSFIVGSGGFTFTALPGLFLIISLTIPRVLSNPFPTWLSVELVHRSSVSL